MDYVYQKDGKLHTRYSELVRCTPGQIEQVIYEREGGERFEGEFTEFGVKRHKMFSKYIKQNSKIPEQFGYDLKVKPENSEKQMACEVAPELVIHFTPDCFGDNWVGDFKTTHQGRKGFKSSRQQKFYAWLLGILGHEITQSLYFLEIWNKERTEIMGYEVLDDDISKEDINNQLDWVLPRARLLYANLKGNK